MNDHQPIEKFLETASAGLAGDRELQLDVQMELRSHLDERLHDAEEAGLQGAEAEAKALAMMGEPLELADKLATANRPRMRLRAWLRHTLRWALVPLAVLVAVACAWQPVRNSLWAINELMFPPNGYTPPCVENFRNSIHYKGFQAWVKGRTPTLTPPTRGKEEQRQLFEGMIRRSFYGIDPAGDAQKRLPPFSQKPRELWEKNRTNKTYLHNYITALIYDWPYYSDRPTYLAKTQELLRQLQAYDPDNARFDYLLAGLVYGSKGFYVETNSQDGNSYHEELIIKNRVQLDLAMQYVRQGLEKSELHHHASEMEYAYWKTLDRPTTIAESLQQARMMKLPVWGPDQQYMKCFVQVAPLYGELLAKEGRKEESEFFLNAWKRMANQILPTDKLSKDYVVTAAFGCASGGRFSALVYNRLGEPEKAAKAKAEVEQALAACMTWQQSRYVFSVDQARLARFGVEMRGYCYNFIGSPDFPEKELAGHGRNQEYLLADSLMAGVISCLALVAIVGCLIVTLWFQFKLKTAPMLLLPSLGSIAMIASGGILLPLLAYQVLVHFLPCAGREYSLFYAWPKFIALQVFLIVSIGWLTTTLTSHFLRRRCRQLGVPTSPKGHWGWLAAAGTLLVIQLAFCCIPDSDVLIGKPPSLWPLLPAAALLLLVIINILLIIPPPTFRIWNWLVSLFITISLFLIIKRFAIDYIVWQGEVKVDSMYYYLLILNLLGFLGVPAFLWLFFTWRRRRESQHPSRHFYWGSLIRSQIPVLAFAMLILNSASTTWYRFQERRIVEQKCAILISPENGQLVFQNRAVEKLRAEMQAALEKIGK